ncbi:MAG: hypothetical protein NVS3B20_01330 [Polyangiales bacterium]
MARTQLMDLLLRSLRTVRGAEREGVSPLEYAETEEKNRARLQAQHALTRRTFLSGVTVTAAATALAACGAPADDSLANASPISADREVLVIGGGMGGLHCAHRLQQLGVNAQVFEGSKRLGGRMHTDRSTFPNGMHCEIGGELIDTGHQTMIDLAEEFKIDLYDYRHDDAALEPLVAHIAGRRLTQAEILEGFRPIAAKIETSLRRLTDANALISHKFHTGASSLDALSLSQWLDWAEADGPVRKMLEAAYVIEFGLEMGACNALNFLTFIATDTRNFQIYGASDERFHTKTGNVTFIDKLARSLHPETLHLEHRFLALKERADGQYVASFQTSRGVVDITAPHVVLSLPFTILRELELKVELPATKRRAIRELGYGANAKLMVGFESRPWRAQRSNGTTFSDLRYQASWETSRLQPGASGIITNFVGGNRAIQMGAGTAEERRDEFLRDWDEVFPGASAKANSKVVRAFWPGNPWVKASYAAYTVGQYTTIAGAEGERVRNLHFAGEHTSRSAQGYMDGAALTGAIAASEIAKDLNVRAKIASLSPIAQTIWKRAFSTGAIERV